jgi:hypothetical protein
VLVLFVLGGIGALKGGSGSHARLPGLFTSLNGLEHNFSLISESGLRSAASRFFKGAESVNGSGAFVMQL